MNESRAIQRRRLLKSAGLGLGAFAFIDTKLCGEFHALAEAKKVSVAVAFQTALGGPIETLGLAAANAWRLPQKFQDMLGYFAGTVEEVDPLASQALGYANFVAEGNGFGLHAWNPAPTADATAFELVALPEDEVAEVVVMIQQYVDERSKAA